MLASLRMPRTISLAAYTIKVWNLDEKDAEPVSDFADSNDLLKFFQGLFAKLKVNPDDNKKVQQVVSVTELKTDGRNLYGVIETGEYGVESNIWSTETNKVVHKKKASEAEMLPFYFLLYIPEGPDEAILLLQRSSTFGIRRVLQQLAGPAFEEGFEDYQLRFFPLVEPDEVAKYVEGKVQSIRFIRFNIPSDLASSYDTGHEEVQGRVELVVRARRGKSLPINNRLRQFFAGKKELGQLIALKETNFQYDNIKVKTKVGSGSRTIDLASPKHLRSYYDISADVGLDKNGHPQFDSIHTLALDLLNRIKKKIYVTAMS